MHTLTPIVSPDATREPTAIPKGENVAPLPVPDGAADIHSADQALLSNNPTTANLDTSHQYGNIWDESPEFTCK